MAVPQNAGIASPHSLMPALQYLEFDYSEDAEGTGTWDAIASVTAAHLPPLQDEIVQVLAWATAEFPGQRGPIEEGGVWDYDLHSEPEDAPLQTLNFDAATRQLLPAVAVQAGSRHTITLSLSGNAAFGQALNVAFSLE